MRSTIARLCLALALVSPALSTPSPETAHLADLEEDVLGTTRKSSTLVEDAAETKNGDALLDASTLFNDMTVPPMKDLSGEAFKEEAKDGYW